MSETETSPPVARIRTPLEIFFIKLAAVLAACAIFLLFAVIYVEGEIRGVARDMKREAGDALNGGPAFWAGVEKTLYRIADEKDLPAEKKARILAALRRIAQKYNPYLDALSQPAPARKR